MIQSGSKSLLFVKGSLTLIILLFLGCEPGKLPDPEGFVGGNKPLQMVLDSSLTETICEDVPVLLDATHPNAISYLWSTGDSTANIQVSDSGLYGVTVNTSSGSRFASALLIPSNQNFIFPSFFSPDGGGYNDTYSINTNCIYSLSLRVLNAQYEWQTVFETQDKDFSWDGTNKRGKRVPSGSYQVIYKATFYSGETLEGSYWLEIVY